MFLSWFLIINRDNFIEFVILKVTLAGFRSGKFMTLVATNVAARGLDINDVQLIIQVCLPVFLGGCM